MPDRMTQVKLNDLNGMLGYSIGNGMRSGMCWKDTGESAGGDPNVPAGQTTFTPWSTRVGGASGVVVETETLVHAIACTRSTQSTTRSIA